MRWTEHIVEHGRAALSEVELHYVTAGTGPLVVLLHGFPEFWYSWHHQIPALVDAGFRVVAPDMRGYNQSAKPSSVSNYRVEFLARDIAELIEYFGESQSHVAGHDWGGLIAWFFAMLHPDRLRRLAILDCPHPGHARAMLCSPVQLRRSLYVSLFQLSGLAESVVACRGFAALRRTLEQDPVHEGAFTEAEIARYVSAAAQPGALTSALNYYRALVQRNPLDLERMLRIIDAPVQVIWGARDRYLGVEFAAPPKRWVPDCRLAVLEHASHWVQADAPAAVNEAMVGFFTARN